MNRNEIIETFRAENPRFKTIKALPEATANSWCKEADKDVCAKARCLAGDFSFTTVIGEPKYDLTNENAKFFDIDEYPGGGIAYDNDRLKKTTIAELDVKNPSWRTADDATPRKYYKRGQYIYLVDPPDDALTVQVYCLLISDDFNSGEKTPFNGLTYLEPYHYAIVKFMKWKSEQKKGGKRQDSLIAKAEYEDYIAYMKKMLGGIKYGPIRFRKP